MTGWPLRVADIFKAATCPLSKWGCSEDGQMAAALRLEHLIRRRAHMGRQNNYYNMSKAFPCVFQVRNLDAIVMGKL